MKKEIIELLAILYKKEQLLMPSERDLMNKLIQELLKEEN